MSNLKVGDIVRFDRPHPNAEVNLHTARGVITKIETKIAKPWPPPGRTHAVVLWFRTGERLAVNVDWLIKVEERGV